MSLSLTSQLMIAADGYCALVGLSRSRVSTLIFGDGMRLEGVAGGRDLNTRSFERAMVWFSSNWPEGAEWPEGVERPSQAAAEVSTDEAAA